MATAPNLSPMDITYHQPPTPQRRRVSIQAEGSTVSTTSDSKATRQTYTPIAQFDDASQSLDVSSNARRSHTPANSEAFYKSYLDKKDKSTRPPFCPWLSRLNVEQCVAALPASLAPDPLLVVEQSGDDVELLEKCLRAFTAKICAQHLPQNEERAAIANARAGVRALRWLTARPGLYAEKLTGDLIQLIVHCMVAERADEFIWEWLLVDQDANVRSRNNPDFKVFWKGFVARCFLQSTAYWGEKGERVNDACTIFRQYLNKGPKWGVPMAYSGSWLRTHLLKRGDHEKVAPSLYATFIHGLRVWQSGPSDLEFTRARLLLVHPTDPDPLPALRFIQKHDSPEPKDPFTQDLFNPRGHQVATLLFSHLLQIAQTLSRGGRTSEARYILDFGRRTIPMYFDLPGKTHHKRLQSAAPFPGPHRFPTQNPPSYRTKWQ
ncbi:hypothetical protein PRZ48_010691 [Zasmidium cellare]|uniref:Uncharacterized protein n=1 Tax=Zasmidium cellare TaxID=395010 RepID=A0ABR0E9C7_ZASCE|nr:hypothetical protein PRZ48_010691 [Zasmidium cellare]